MPFGDVAVMSAFRKVALLEEQHPTSSRQRNWMCPYQANLTIHFFAVTVISMCALADASFTTPNVVRAGRGSLK